MRPTYRGLTVAAAGLVPALLPTLVAAPLWRLWLGWWLLLAAAGGYDAVACRRWRRLVWEAELPGQLHVGVAAPAVFRLALPASRPVAAEVALDVGELLEPVARRRLTLAAGEATEVRLPLRPRRRGPASVETLWLRFEGPLGLVHQTLRQPLRRTLPVVPDVPRVRSEALRFLDSRDARAGVKVVRYVGDGSEFESLREFQPGLDPRAIDWKASARHTQLLSRELRAERNHRIVLGVDTGRLMAEPVAGMPLLDHAIHAALLLSFISLRHGDRVSLFPFAARPGRLSPPRGGTAALRALVRLAGELRYSTDETNFTLGLTDLATRLRRRSLVVVLTDFVDSVTAELMVENLLRLRRRHLVLFVALRDPALGELVDAEPQQLFDVGRAVVAGSLLRDREETLGRLRRGGVFAIDAPPRRVAPQLINRYLEIKRREMI